jgi:hypothetical protein
MGFKSGEYGGHSNTRNLNFSNHFLSNLNVYIGALSYIKTKPDELTRLMDLSVGIPIVGASLAHVSQSSYPYDYGTPKLNRLFAVLWTPTVSPYNVSFGKIWPGCGEVVANSLFLEVTRYSLRMLGHIKVLFSQLEPWHKRIFCS